jgi:hypothetical protein
MVPSIYHSVKVLPSAEQESVPLVVKPVQELPCLQIPFKFQFLVSPPVGTSLSSTLKAQPLTQLLATGQHSVQSEAPDIFPELQYFPPEQQVPPLDLQS